MVQEKFEYLLQHAAEEVSSVAGGLKTDAYDARDADNEQFQINIENGLEGLHALITVIVDDLESANA